MRENIYNEISGQLFFTVFDSKKSRKTDKFRIHHHAELELGYIISGEGDYHLEDERYDARAGDLFVVRANEQHCIPTVHTAELSSFNLHISPTFLWNICAEFIDSRSLHALIHSGQPICHRHRNFGAVMEQLRILSEDSVGNRFQIRHTVLTLLMQLSENLFISDSASPAEVSNRLSDIQQAIAYIHTHMAEPLTLDEIAKAANMCRSLLCAQFKLVTGISPYEYLLILRIEHALALLSETDLPILSVAQRCGFDHASNFNKKFKRITGMTPREYRTGKQQTPKA